MEGESEPEAEPAGGAPPESLSEDAGAPEADEAEEDPDGKDDDDTSEDAEEAGSPADESGAADKGALSAAHRTANAVKKANFLMKFPFLRCRRG